MPASKAQQAATNRYNTKTYDRFSLMLPKGYKAAIKAHVEGSGESLNGFIKRAIDQAIDQDRQKR